MRQEVSDDRWAGQAAPDGISGHRVVMAAATGAAVLVLTCLVVGAVAPGQRGAWIAYLITPVTVSAASAATYLRLGNDRAGNRTGAALLVAAACLPALLLWHGVVTHRPTLLVLAVLPAAALAMRPWCSTTRGHVLDRAGPYLLAGPPVLVFVALTSWDGPVPHGIAEGLTAACVAVSVSALAGARLPSLGRRSGRALDGLVVATITLLLLTLSPHFDAEGTFSWDFYLGPANDVVHGRTVLIDTASQYGIGNIYALALLMRVAGTASAYTSAAILVSALWAALCVVAYAILRRMLVGRPLAVAALIAIIALQVYGSVGVFYEYPSTGPLRFGLPLLTVLGFILPSQGRLAPGRWLPPLCLYLASIWSAETLSYTLAVYAAGACFKACATGGRRDLHSLVLRGLPALSSACIVVGAGIATISVFTYVRSGSLPHWDTYFVYVKAYSVSGYSSVGANWSTPWLLVAAPLLFSSCALVVRWRHWTASVSTATPAPVTALAAVTLTVLGMVEFSYFIARMDPNNIRHVVLPAALLTAYWLHIAQRHLPRGSARVAQAIVLVATVPYLVSAASHLVVNGQRALGPATLGQLVGGAPAVSVISVTTNPQDERPALEAAVTRLLQQIPWPDAVPIAVASSAQNSALFATGHFNQFPVQEPCEAALDPTSLPAARRAVAALMPGRWVLIQDRGRGLAPLNRYYVDLLLRHFTWSATVDAGSGIQARRIAAISGDSTWDQARFDPQAQQNGVGCS